MNSVHLIGRLTKDPQLNTGGENSTPLCNFNIAIDRPNSKEETDFPRITVFGKTAENLTKFVKKGDLISVEASVRTSSFEKDGQRQFSSQIVASRIQFLERKKETSESYNVAEEYLPF